MAFDKHNLGATSYAQTMNTKTAQYNSLIRRAEILSRDNDGRPTKEEAELYVMASDVCAEIMNMNLSQRSVYAKWQLLKTSAEQEATRILDILAPRPVPVSKPAPKENAPVANQTAGGSVDTPAAATASGFVTKNATDRVPAATIESWYQEMPKNSLDDLIGMEDVVEDLKRRANNLRFPHTDSHYKISPQCGFMLYGLPGNGKTHTVLAFANYLMNQYENMKFIQLSGADVMDPLVGVAEKRVQIAFKEAIDNAPALLFFDEIDGICPVRANAKQHEAAVTNAFLEGWNNIERAEKAVIVIGATNYPWRVDPAVCSRLSNRICLPLPSEPARERFFAQRLNDVTVAKGVSPEIMAATTDHFDYRDLNALADALILDLRDRAVALVTDFESYEERDRKTYEIMFSGHVRVDVDDYERIRYKMTPSSTQAQIAAMEEYAQNNGS